MKLKSIFRRGITRRGITRRGISPSIRNSLDARNFIDFPLLKTNKSTRQIILSLFAWFPEKIRGNFRSLPVHNDSIRHHEITSWRTYKRPRAKVQSFIANMNARQECQGYVEKIFLSIKKNLDALDDEQLLRGFLEAINKFYTSLFAQTSGRSFNFLAEFLKIERRCRFYQTSPRASLSWCIVGTKVMSCLWLVQL